MSYLTLSFFASLYSILGCGFIAISYWICPESFAVVTTAKVHWRNANTIGRMRVAVGCFLGGVAAVIVAPPIAAWAVCQMICESIYWRRFSRTFRDTRLKPIALEHMLPEAQAFIREHSELMDSLGFRMLGNFQIKPEPFVNEYRFYLSADGRVLVGIGRVDTSVTCCVMSYFAEGPIVETSLSSCPSLSESFFESVERHGEFFGQQFGSNLNLDVAIEYHQSLVDKVRSARGIEAYSLKSGDLEKMIFYQNRKFGSVLSKMRKLNSMVDEPTWPFESREARPICDTSSLSVGHDCSNATSIA